MAELLIGTFRVEEDEEIYYVLFSKEENTGIPVFVKTPESGIFWQAEASEDDDFGRPLTDKFTQNMSAVLDDPLWRQAVDPHSDVDRSLLDDVDLSFVTTWSQDNPAEAELFVEIIEGVQDGVDLPTRLSKYLLELT
jgi:hypothetical protein